MWRSEGFPPQAVEDSHEVDSDSDSAGSGSRVGGSGCVFVSGGAKCHAERCQGSSLGRGPHLGKSDDLPRRPGQDDGDRHDIEHRPNHLSGCPGKKDGQFQHERIEDHLPGRAGADHGNLLPFSLGSDDLSRCLGSDHRHEQPSRQQPHVPGCVGSPDGIGHGEEVSGLRDEGGTESHGACG